VRSVTLILPLLVVLIPGSGVARGEPLTRTRFFRDIVIQPEETAADAVCYFCSVHVRGTLSGDAVAFWGGIDVDGSVEQDAVAVGGGIRLRRGARLGGDAVALGGPVLKNEASAVGGEAVAKPFFMLPGQMQVFLPGTLAFSALSLSLAVVAYLILQRGRTENVVAVLRYRRRSSVLAGITIGTLALGFYYLSLLVGPAGPYLAMAVSVLLLLLSGPGYAGLCLYLGEGLLPRRHPLRSVLLGAVVLTALFWTPIAGFLAVCVVIPLALGCAAFSRFGGARESELMRRLRAEMLYQSAGPRRRFSFPLPAEPAGVGPRDLSRRAS